METLCREGKAPSYTTDFFSRGSMTRYELASVIKDMLEHHNEKDKDHESLMKLKKEYARELEALGYREEKKIPEGKPMLEMSGDGRIRYNSDGDADGRVRVNTRWRIGDDTTVNAGGTKNVKIKKRDTMVIHGIAFLGAGWWGLGNRNWGVESGGLACP